MNEKPFDTRKVEEAIKQQQESQDKVRRAAQRVLGRNGHRSEDQALVWAWIKALCNADVSCIGKDSHDTYAREGARMVYLAINNIINTQTEEDE